MSNADDKQHKDAEKLTKLRPLIREFIRMLLDHPDLKEAKKMVAEHAKLLWKKTWGAELESVKLDVKTIESSFAKASDIHSSLTNKLRNTKAYVPAASVYGEKDSKGIPFADWQSKDKVIVVLSLIAALVVLTMGAANVYANILGSGNPIFIEQPYLAVIISMLVPTGSIAMKFVTDKFESDRTKAMYTKTLSFLAVLALLTWTVLFALNFHGLSADIDFEGMGETSPTASALTWIQLLAELLVEFVLCQTASDTYAKYAPNAFVRNPEYIEIESTLNEHAKPYEALGKERNPKRGRDMELTVSEQLFIEESVVLYLNMRRRFDDSSPT